MYCVNQLLPPCIFNNSLLMRVAPVVAEGDKSHEPMPVVVLVQGSTLRATIVTADGASVAPAPSTTTTASSCSTFVGEMPLAMVACAESTMLLLTERHHVILLQLTCRKEAQVVDEDNEEADMNDATGKRRERSVWRLALRNIFHTFVPMETLINKPPTFETPNPTLRVSPDGQLVALQSYRGWIHIVHIGRALEGTYALDAVINPFQLEQKKMLDACFLPLPSQSEPVFVPVFERALHAVKGYFVTKKPKSNKPPTLVDAVRRWHLPGAPHKVLGLSHSAIPTTSSTFTLLDGVDTTTHMVFAVTSNDGTHRLVFSSLIPKRVTQVMSSPAVEMVEVALANGKGSEVWVLDDKGRVWMTSLELLDTIVKVGDCEERGLTPVVLQLPSSCGRLSLLTSMAPRALDEPVSLVAVGDGQSVFVIDARTRLIVRSFLSDGPLVSVCDGPRGSLVTLQGSGKLALWRSAIKGSNLLAQVDLDGITNIIPYHPIPTTGTNVAASSDGGRRPLLGSNVNTFAFLVCQGTSRTRAFELNLEHGELAEVEQNISDGRRTADFDPREDTLAATFHTTPGAPSSSGEGGPLCALEAALVSRRRAMWSRWSHTTGGFQTAGSLTSTDALVLAGVSVMTATTGNEEHATSEEAPHFSHAAFCTRSSADVEASSSWNASEAVVCSVGRHLLLLTKDSSRDRPQSVALAEFDSEVAAISFIRRTQIDAPSVGHTCVEVATAVWGTFDVQWSAYTVARSREGGVTATVQSTLLVSLTSPHMVRTLLYEPPCTTAGTQGQLWVTDASGNCFRWYDSRSSNPNDTERPSHSVPLGDCVLVESLSFPFVSPVTRIATCAHHQESTASHSATAAQVKVRAQQKRILEPSIVVLREQDAEIVAPVAGTGGVASWFSVNVLLAQGDASSAPPDNNSAHLSRKVRCGAAVSSVFDGLCNDNIVVLSADTCSLYLNQFSFAPARPELMEGRTLTTALSPSAESVQRRSARDYITALHNVRSFQLPCVDNVQTDRATIVLSVNIIGSCAAVASSPRAAKGLANCKRILLDTSGLFVVADTSSASMICVVDGSTLVPRDAIRMKDTEFISCAQVLPNGEHDAVVVATGICRVPAPSDPTSGRIVVVGVNPLHFRACYTAEREGFYSVAVCTHHFTRPLTATVSSSAGQQHSDYDGLGDMATSSPSRSIVDDESSSTLIIGGLPSKMIMLRLVAGNLVPMVTVPLAQPPVSIAISYPFISVSNMNTGSSIFEITTQDAQQTPAKDKTEPSTTRTPLPPTTAASPTSPPEGSHAVTYRIVQRCMESFANALTHVDVSYAPRRFLRCDLNQNINFVALDAPGARGASQEADGAAIVEDTAGGVGLTSSPVVPSTVAMMRLGQRVISTHITRAKHSAVGFFTATTDASRSNVIPVRGVTSFNLNSQSEADFTVQSTAPRVFLGGDDGALSVVCGIPSELSRVLARVEHSVAHYLDANFTLRPQNERVSSSTFGFAPTLLPHAANSDDDVRVSSSDAAGWTGGIQTSLVSCAAATATFSMVRQSIRLGIVDRTLVDHFLKLSAAQREESNVVAALQLDCNNLITTEDVLSIVAALTFLD